MREKQNAVLTTYLTKAQKKAVERKAKELDKKTSEVLRELIDKYLEVVFIQHTQT